MLRLYVVSMCYLYAYACLKVPEYVRQIIGVNVAVMSQKVTEKACRAIHTFLVILNVDIESDGDGALRCHPALLWRGFG